MELKQIEHINQLIFEDNLKCKLHLESIEISNYSEEVKNILSGYFRTRSELNQQILADNGYYEEENINAQKLV